MEFWGAEVKSGTPLKVKPGEGMVIHVSQASMAEVKVKANKESVSFFVNVDGKKLVLGTLSSDKFPQQQLDLIFDRDFELFHNSKSGSVFFFGYKYSNRTEEEKGFDSDDSEEEDISLMAGHGKREIKAEIAKPMVPEKAKEIKRSAADKKKVKIVEPTKDEDDDSEDDDSGSEEEFAEKQKPMVPPKKAKENKGSVAGKQKVEQPEDDDTEDDDSDEDEASDKDLIDEDDSSDSEDESEEDEETPKKAAAGKKRVAESTIKTPVPVKKAKLATPEKTDKKSDGHVPTPYPSKQAGKTPANKASKQGPKPGGLHSCGPCHKGFASENALQAHTKAKHGAGK